MARVGLIAAGDHERRVRDRRQARRAAQTAASAAPTSSASATASGCSWAARRWRRTVSIVSRHASREPRQVIGARRSPPPRPRAGRPPGHPSARGRSPPRGAVRVIRRRDQRERGDALGVREREAHGRVRAHRGAREDCSLDARRVEHRQQVAGESLITVARARAPVRSARDRARRRRSRAGPSARAAASPSPRSVASPSVRGAARCRPLARVPRPSRVSPVRAQSVKLARRRRRARGLRYARAARARCISSRRPLRRLPEEQVADALEDLKLRARDQRRDQAAVLDRDASRPRCRG